VDACLVVAEFAAVEDVEDLVAFLGVWRPVGDKKLPGFALDAQFFYELPLTSCCRRFALVDVTPRDIPAIAVGLMNQQDAVLVHEQRPSRDPRSREPGCGIAHPVTVASRSCEPEPGRKSGKLGSGLAALLAYPGQDELAADVVMSDLHGRELFGVQ
jgi:hypothetical protein